MINSSTSPSDLAFLLGTKISRLCYVLYGIGTTNLYSTFDIPKKNGEKRVIRAPKPQLKQLQLRLKNHLENMYKPHFAAAAFVKERGIVFNAKKHIRKKVVFNLDLENFYDQINFGRVKGLLRAAPYSLREDTAQLIAHLCCVDRVVPQGAPSSPIISNMICRKLDRELSLLAKENKFIYSRYADDITFSSHKECDNEIFDKVSMLPSSRLSQLISSNGFAINSAKTRLQNYKQRQVVTGLKVNQILNIDRRYIRTTKAMIHSLSAGSEAANEVHRLKNGDESPSLEAVVYGRINYIRMVKGVESSVFRMLATKFNQLEAAIKITTSPKLRNSKLEEKLHFYGHENRRNLERCVWVVSFEGIDGLSVEQELVQATSFMCEGQRMFTAAHVFAKAGNSDECYVYRIYEQHIKYRAKVVSKCNVSDVAELKIQDENLPWFHFLKLAPEPYPRQGYRLSLIGFPQLRTGHDSLSIIPCTVINTFTRSTFRFGEIDVDIHGGNSGGPVVNVYMQVVGLALVGVGIVVDNITGEAHLEGANTYISAEHLK